MALYDRAARLTTKFMGNEIVRKSGQKQENELSEFKKEDLYRVYPCLEDTVMTSKGSECQIRSAIRNKICEFEPQ